MPDGTVVVDSGVPSPGRGAYVCPDTACLERGLSRGRLGHAFKKPSEASLNLPAAVRAVAPHTARIELAESSPGGTPLCEVGARAIGDVDVITVRA
jgi:hypothetical protein